MKTNVRMQLIVTRCLALYVLLLMGCSSIHPPAPMTELFAGDKGSIFVAVDGNDTNPGTRRKPFATFERARDEVRKLNTAKTSDKPIIVAVRGGDYIRTSVFELSAGDSGTAAAPVIWRAYNNERVRLFGGRTLTGFQPVTDPAVVARFVEAARQYVVELNLRAIGIAPSDEMVSRGFGRPISVSHMELFFDNRPMTLARWPNEGQFEKIAGYPAETNQQDEDPAVDRVGRLQAGFLYSGDKPRRWQDTSNIWVHGYWAYDWANSYEKVASLDVEQHLVTTAPPHGTYGFRKDQRFYFLNVLEELDQPGEWFLDRKTDILYFWPPDAQSALAAPQGQPRCSPEILLSQLKQPILRLTEVSNVFFHGITLEAARANAVEIHGGTNNRIAGCLIRNIGNTGVVIEGGTGHGVVSCDIFDTGDGGVSLSGGDRQTLVPGGHFVENCRFQRQGRWSKCYVPAIKIGGVGLRASHNLIYDQPHCAILFTGNDHVMEFNEIHHIALETGDVGAIYTGRDFSYRGNKIRHNFIHHTGGVGMGSMGVYMDDCVSGTEILGNVFYKVHWAIFIGGGRDHHVENNLFVDCDPAVRMDGRGLDSSPPWRGMVEGYMRVLLTKVPLPLYRTRYQEMKTLDAYYGPPEGPTITREAFKGVPPENNAVLRNVCVGKWVETIWNATPEMLRLENNLTNAESSLARTLNDQSVAMDFELKKDSPAWALGFHRILLDQIGLRKDDFRRGLSVKLAPPTKP